MERYPLTQQHDAGASSEAIVAAYLLSKGHDVYVPLKTQSRGDLIYLRDGVPVKVQVKSGTRTRTGRFTYEQCRLLSKGGGIRFAARPYSALEIDEVWVVGTHLWRFPAEVVIGRSSLYLATDNPNPKPSVSDYKSADYIEVRGAWDVPYRYRLTHDA